MTNASNVDEGDHFLSLYVIAMICRGNQDVGTQLVVKNIKELWNSV